MLKHAALGVFVLAAIAAPAGADLHYTMHTEARQTATTDAANPMFSMAGDMLIRTMFPEGPTDSTYWVTDKGVRIELTKANALMPAGSVLLQLLDGTMAVLNPKEHTYWKVVLPAFPLPLLAGMSQKPEISVVHTGQFDEIAGIRAERTTSTITVQIPAPPTGIPPGMPPSITMSTDSWTSEKYATYAALSKGMAAMMGVGGELLPEGFSLKSVTRSSLLPGFEIESVVTAITEEPAPADALEIPPDYKETPAPTSLSLPAQLP